MLAEGEEHNKPRALAAGLLLCSANDYGDLKNDLRIILILNVHALLKKQEAVSDLSSLSIVSQGPFTVTVLDNASPLYQVLRTLSRLTCKLLTVVTNAPQAPKRPLLTQTTLSFTVAAPESTVAKPGSPHELSLAATTAARTHSRHPGRALSRSRYASGSHSLSAVGLSPFVILVPFPSSSFSLVARLDHLFSPFSHKAWSFSLLAFPSSLLLHPLFFETLSISKPNQHIPRSLSIPTPRHCPSALCPCKNPIS